VACWSNVARLENSMKVIPISNRLCDVFWGADYWHDTEWTRFEKRLKGWTPVSGPESFMWFNVKKGEYETCKAYLPKGSKYKKIIQAIEEAYVKSVHN
jgi:hypothetical protein